MAPCRLQELQAALEACLGQEEGTGDGGTEEERGCTLPVTGLLIN